MLMQQLFAFHAFFTLPTYVCLSVCLLGILDLLHPPLLTNYSLSLVLLRTLYSLSTLCSFTIYMYTLLISLLFQDVQPWELQCPGCSFRTKIEGLLEVNVLEVVTVVVVFVVVVVVVVVVVDVVVDVAFRNHTEANLQYALF